MATVDELTGLTELNRTINDSYEDELSTIDDLLELDAPLEVHLITREKGFNAVGEHWKRLVDRPGVKATVFQTYEWQRVWWQYFGRGKNLHILSIWDQKRLVGLVPFFVETTSIFGLYEYRKLKLLGSEIPDSKGLFSTYSPTDYLDVIIDPNYLDGVVETILRYLKRTQALFDQIDLNELPEEGVFIEHILPGMAKQNWSYKKTERESCPAIVLPNSMDAYLDDLDRKIRYELRYSKRAVTEKDLFRIVEVTDENEFEEAFNHFVVLHQKRWHTQGYPGIFYDPEFKEFLKEVGRQFLNNGYLKFTLAFDKDDNCIAVDYAFKFKKGIYDYQKAFDIESDLAKYSPGKTLLYFLIDTAINEGVEKVDLLRGGERYKMKVAGKAPGNWRVKVPNPNSMTGLKYRLYSLMRAMKSIQDQIAREILLFRIHYRQFGRLEFLRLYSSFIKSRIGKKLYQ